jgi:1,4-dihydroxy-2-naphthoate octaprenyltransferase
MTTLPFEAGGASWSRSLEYGKRFVLHLRLTFNYVLAPLFFWGAFVSGAAPGWKFWLGFIAFHVFLYGGTNMFNSYYDRDEGPIGGLEQPPPVDRGLLVGSLALKAIGLAMAFFCGAAFVVCYLLFALYSFSYSHPAIRIKSRPLASAATVFVGQGIVGYLAGWFAAGGSIDALVSLSAAVGAFGGAIMVSAIYPLTQMYQLDEDSRRSDLTLARWLGIRNSFRYIMVLLSAGSVCLCFVFWSRDLWWVVALLVLYLCAAMGYLSRLSMHIRFRDFGTREIYRRVMKFNYVNSTLLLALLAVNLWTDELLWFVGTHFVPII